MEAIIAIVGFLGVGKTTQLKRLTKIYLDSILESCIILDDYQSTSFL